MPDPIFFPPATDLTLGEVAALARVAPPEGVDLAQPIRDAAALETAGAEDIAYMDNVRYVAALRATHAGFCLVSPRFAEHVPAGTLALVVPKPYDAFAAVLSRLHPEAARPASLFGATGVSPGSSVHPTARLEPGVTIDPGAVIGPHAEIGTGTVIGAASVIGPHVRIGRYCSIGPNVTILCSLIGNRVIIHPGTRIGQDGFGFAMGAGGHQKVPQVGRVVIQDDVEIGANTTIDRGASRDTMIGEGTKIDNQVQIGHNTVIGRHCVIVSQTGISGSTTLEDFVVLGGKVGTVGHTRFGRGAQVAAGSHVYNDVPPGGRWAGILRAKPLRDYMREVAALKQLAARGDKAAGRSTTERDDPATD